MTENYINKYTNWGLCCKNCATYTNLHIYRRLLMLLHFEAHS